MPALKAHIRRQVLVYLYSEQNLPIPELEGAAEAFASSPLALQLKMQKQERGVLCSLDLNLSPKCYYSFGLPSLAA